MIEDMVVVTGDGRAPDERDEEPWSSARLASVVADIVNTNRSGTDASSTALDGRIVSSARQAGQGGAFVRTAQEPRDRRVVDDTFRAGEKFPRVHTEVKNVQFLYDDGSEAHFWTRRTSSSHPARRGLNELAYMLPS